MKTRMPLIVWACMVLCVASCRPSRSTPAAVPTVAQVKSALERAGVRLPYKDCVVSRLEPLGHGRFLVLFDPTDYRGKPTPVPFPLEGYATNNGYIVCCPEQGEDGALRQDVREVFIPFKGTRPGAVRTRNR